MTGLAHRDGLVTRRALLITGAAGLLVSAAGGSGSTSGTHPASPASRDSRDTTSARAIGADFEAMVTGTALPPRNRSLLTRWLAGDAAGAGRIRAAVPAGWAVGDKTGTGGYGTDNDIAILSPPGRSPIVLAIMSTRETPGAQPSNTLISHATSVVLPALRRGHPAGSLTAQARS